MGHIIEELMKKDKWYGHNFSLTYLWYILAIMSLINPMGKSKSKFNEKNQYLEQSLTLFKMKNK